MFYFGCLDGPGHYLFDVSLRKLHRTPNDFPINNHEMLDGGFFPKWLLSDSAEGIVVPWACPDWAIFSFRDRSIDRRPGSCSVFVLRMGGDDKPEKTLIRACVAFPTIVQRFTFPLVMDGKRVWPVKEVQSTLLPCPFCGGEAWCEKFFFPVGPLDGERFSGASEAKIACIACNVSVVKRVECSQTDDAEFSAQNAFAKASAVWNARAVSKP